MTPRCEAAKEVRPLLNLGAVLLIPFLRSNDLLLFGPSFFLIFNLSRVLSSRRSTHSRKVANAGTWQHYGARRSSRSNGKGTRIERPFAPTFVGGRFLKRLKRFIPTRWEQARDNVSVEDDLISIDLIIYLDITVPGPLREGVADISERRPFRSTWRAAMRVQANCPPSIHTHTHTLTTLSTFRRKYLELSIRESVRSEDWHEGCLYHGRLSRLKEN